MKRLLAATTLGLALTAPAYSASYVIDPTHTFVTYEVGHFGTSTNRGRFDKKEGTVQFDRTGNDSARIQSSRAPSPGPGSARAGSPWTSAASST